MGALLCARHPVGIEGMAGAFTKSSAPGVLLASSRGRGGGDNGINNSSAACPSSRSLELRSWLKTLSPQREVGRGGEGSALGCGQVSCLARVGQPAGEGEGRSQAATRAARLGGFAFLRPPSLSRKPAGYPDSPPAGAEQECGS